MTEYRYYADSCNFDPMSGQELKKLSDFLNTMSRESGWEVFHYQTLPYPDECSRQIAHIVFRRTYDREYQESSDEALRKQDREIRDLKEQLAKCQQNENKPCSPLAKNRA